MDAKEFADSLFEGYEETAALADFKEELAGNLNAKIESLVKKGMEGETAFAKTTAELGDVSELANQMSLRKRSEAFGEVRTGTRKHISAGRVAAYALFGGLATLGIITGVAFFLTARAADLRAAASVAALFVAAMPFLALAAAGFVFLGVTRETASLRPVSKKRGAWYAAAVALVAVGFFATAVPFFGMSVTDTTGNIFLYPCPCGNDCCEEPCACGRNIQISFDFSGDGAPDPGTLLFLLPFALPGGGLLVFLVRTEKDRLKPRAKAVRRKAKEAGRRVP